MAVKSTKSVYLPPTRVTEDLRDKLRAESERKQTSVSALIRESIIKFISKKNKPRS